MHISTWQFAIHLTTSLLLGAAVGLERQWRHRMAGTRTNALVAAGAAAFVMAGGLLNYDPSAAGRVMSYVVSGVGFLGAGVIFKDGANVSGLNTAATIWCSAAIGVLGGLGSLYLASMVAISVLLANTVLRPLAYRFHPVLSKDESSETRYEIRLKCRGTEEAHFRTLLLTTITQGQASLQALHSEDEKTGDRTRLRAEITVAGRNTEIVERMAVRLSVEPGVSSLSWSVVPIAME
jgi:putative Mg2+ transporter-C (MgtC) family protein